MAYTARSRITRAFQMGPTTANHRFPSLNIDLAPLGNPFDQYRHGGGKQVGQVLAGDIWSGGPLSAEGLDANQITYLLASNVNYAAPTVVGSVATWAFSQDPDNPDTVQVYKAQRGPAGAVTTYPNLLISDLGLTYRRVGASSVAGAALAKGLVAGGTLDTAISVAQAPLSSIKNGIWIGTSYANLVAGATRLDPYGFLLDWHNNGRFGPWFPMDDTVVGPGGFLEGAVDTGGMVTVGFDVTGSDFSGPFNLANMQAGTILFVRVLNVGPLISGTDYYKLTHDMCMQINGVPTQTQDGNILLLQWPFTCVPDAVDNRAFKFGLVNTVTSI